MQPVGIPDWEGEPGPDGEHGAVNVLDFPAHVTRLHADSDIGFRNTHTNTCYLHTDNQITLSDVILGAFLSSARQDLLLLFL